MVKLESLDYKPKPIDQNFLSDEEHYPVTGEHNGHKVRAGGVQRMDAEGKPYPTKNGIHGSIVAVDWEACIADGGCMDVCPVSLFEWALNPGNSGTGNDKKISPDDKENYDKYRTDKCDPVRENECIFCMACESVCPTLAIKINPS
ncbi:zinc-containing ferredoxin [Picrophilus oshimae]|uniref:Zinc-containing ferredoxin n=1 Tax=Picrophilus torridus (strain ATCC 700027 / DSM 9790 / JCM 10055 / NBRC 100828 / KAW 2/3) TaxID=1122961 RepID=Q6L1N9_PICTO|nr:zinc-containing ferredoxin [Picrophilus oshimae]AAT43113.1 ferredoxin [Picrophilus oshimae DSM 9789]SMD30579.1 4Fe-4S dicluster domain-containing protein [Picrophilus oshimae DSM 9789]